MNKFILNRCDCEDCKNVPDSQMQAHHLFSNSKVNRKKYGKLIEHPANKMLISEAHHLWKAVPKYTEAGFCYQVGCEPKTKLESVIKVYNRLINQNK